MHPFPKRSMLLATSLVLAVAACGGDRGGSSPAADTDTEAAAEPVPEDTYATQAFVLPFDVTVPAWLPAAASVDAPHFVTWETTAPEDPAIRFLAPVAVYPPGGIGATPPPQDYLAYLLGQRDFGASFADVTETTVGDMPATLLTATAADSLDGSLGCHEEAMAAPDCFGLQPDLSLRIAVIDAGDTTLLAWLRHTLVAGADDTADEFAAFEQMLTSVRFRGPNGPTSATQADPVATPIDGVWTTSFTYDELAASPLLYDRGELNDDNWGQLTFTFDQGQFGETQQNERATNSGSGTFQLDGDIVVLTRRNGEHFVMRWSLDGDELTFTRDETLGIAPTPFVLTPWIRQP